ncbi:GRAM-domain-containing protein [Piromyces finnis]|uniref:GRAM-domain-containing protein n=1 Tax=Piromyces finnis TaxID=1754191 RepID=A0A1Y1VFZ4_9FUNG|nr:GRAM-domain-containing protein [Piromyces finnis]|eukprot:ORX55335.1 GRAM-domain-containing protein [Piromyces finnis]
MSEIHNNNNVSSSSIDSDTPNQNKSFPKAFRKSGIPNNEVLIERYSCALQRDILLLQGFLYVSKNYFCYYSNVVGFIHKVVIPLSKVKSVTKKNAALVVPNAIQIDTKTGESYFMLSFINRDSVYAQLIEIWNDYKKNHRASLLIRKHLNSNEIRNKRPETKVLKSSNSSKNDIFDFEDKKEATKKGNARFPDAIYNEKEKVSTRKYRRANSTPINMSPNNSPNLFLKRNSTINMKDRKQNSFRKYSNTPKNYLRKENSYLDYDFADDEKVQSDIIFPKYIPKINTMKEYKYLKITLVLTCLVIGFIMIMSIILRLKISEISKEVEGIQNDLPISNTNAYDFSTLLSKKENEDKKNTPKNMKTLEKIKEISQKTGLSIPQLLSIDWNEYELVN